MLIPPKKSVPPNNHSNTSSKMMSAEEEDRAQQREQHAVAPPETNGGGDHGGDSAAQNGDSGTATERGRESNGGAPASTAAPVVTRGYVQNEAPAPAPAPVATADPGGRHIGGNPPAKPAEIKPIPIGDPKVRSKLRFDVVTARVNEKAGKKYVSYSIMIKRVPGTDAQAAVIDRRYSDFVFVYENILKNFHPSILGDFLFPKKVLIGNFKAEVITERTEAFHRFLNLIANCENLLYSEYFYSFLSSEEHNEAVSHIKLGRFEEAVPLLESLFAVQERLLTVSSPHALQCLCELVACLHAVRRYEAALAYALVASDSFELAARGHPGAEAMRVPFLKLASALAGALGHDRRPYDKQLSELRYRGVKVENARPLLEVIRERYIHQASRTATLA